MPPLSSRYLPYILARIEWKLYKLRGDAAGSQGMAEMAEGMGVGDIFATKKKHEKDVFKDA